MTYRSEPIDGLAKSATEDVKRFFSISSTISVGMTIRLVYDQYEGSLSGDCLVQLLNDQVDSEDTAFSFRLILHGQEEGIRFNQKVSPVVGILLHNAY